MGAAPNPGGTQIESSITVLSASTSQKMRTVILSRPARGLTKSHANFTLTDVHVPIINAIGSGPTFGYHANKTASSLSLWPIDQEGKSAPVCLCSQPAAPFGTALGTIKYAPTGEEFGFINACVPEPRESVLAEHNPTCDIRAYTGGLQVCKHMWSL